MAKHERIRISGEITLPLLSRLIDAVEAGAACLNDSAGYSQDPDEMKSYQRNARILNALQWELCIEHNAHADGTGKEWK